MKRVDADKMDRAIALYVGGKPISEVVSISGIGKSSIYRELERRGIPRHERGRRKS